MNPLNKVLRAILPNPVEREIDDYLRRKRNIELYNPEQYKNPVYESSLMGFDYYRCIFIHIPKCAGISIAHSIFGNNGRGHRTIQDYQRIFSPRTFQKYFKFTIVRNPYDRLVSAYHFLKKGGMTNQDRQWSELHLSQVNSFEEFVLQWLNKDSMRSYIHFLPQAHFLTDDKGTIPLDFIGRFENLSRDYKTIVSKLGIDRVIEQQNQSERAVNYEGYYSQALREKVAKLYSDDFDLLGYFK